MIKLLKNNVKCQGYLKVKVIMMYVCEKVMTLATMCVSQKEIGWLMKRIFEENETLTQNFYKPKFSSKNLAKNDSQSLLEKVSLSTCTQSLDVCFWV